MDAVTLDRLIDELRPRLLGRHLRRPRCVRAHALALEISGDPDGRLWLDARRPSPGCYRVSRAQLESLEREREPLPGRTRQALLLLRKHVDGRRTTALRRIPGERVLVLSGAGFELVLRFSDPAPALTLAVDGSALASIGPGPPAWPIPGPAPEREWDRLDAEALERAIAEAEQRSRSPAGAILSRWPGLGPLAARRLAREPGVLGELLRRLGAPRPTLYSTLPLGEARDADLAPPDTPRLASFELPGGGPRGTPWAGWLDAAAACLVAGERGRIFASRQRAALESAGRERRRLEQLELNLAKDRAELPDPAQLRGQAVALLASPGGEPARGGALVSVPDPHREGARVEVVLDPRLDLPGNADKLFARARRIERGRAHIDERLIQVGAALAEARSREESARAARELAELGAPGPARGGDRTRAPAPGAARLHYLTSRGLSIWIGRGARENHELTFGRARREDLWFHARGVPGAHVVLRDGEGRAGATDLREAAEVAAWFSDARDAERSDVQFTRRKHLRPVKGAPGRVQVFHSETLRVAPRDPEGRLRRR